MTRNITLKLEDKLVKRARHIAVNENTSVSAWVSNLIEIALKDRDQHARSRREALKVLAHGFSLGGKPLDRDSIYE